MKKKKVYVRLLISYLVVFLTPLLLSVANLWRIAESSRVNMRESVRANLDHAGESLDKYFQELDTIVENLSRNRSVVYVATLMDREDKYVEISKPNAIREAMRSMRLQTFAEEYYLYFDKMDMVISPEQTFLDAHWWKNFFQYGEMEQEAWLFELHQSHSGSFYPALKSRQNTGQEEMLLYMHSLVMTYGVKGTFVFPIKSQAIKDILEDSFVSKGGWTYMIDKNGRVILSMPSKEGEMIEVPWEELPGEKGTAQVSLGGRKAEVIQIVSKQTGLSLVTVLPVEYITQQMSKSVQRTVLLMAVVVAVGIMAILNVSRSRSRRIDDVLQLLLQLGDENFVGGGRKGILEDEMHYISTSLKKLIARNTVLQDKLRRQEPITRGFLLESLLRGDSKRALLDLEEYGISFVGKRLVVLSYLIGEPEGIEQETESGETVVYKQMLQQRLEEMLVGESYLCEPQMNTGVILYVAPGEEKWETVFSVEKLTRLCDDFWEEYGMVVRIAISDVCEDVAKISRVYDQVCDLLRFGTASKQQVLLCRDYQDSQECYYFPVTVEERLVNAVRCGDTESLHQQLKEIYQLNILNRNMSPAMMHFLINDLQCAVFKVVYVLHEHEEIRQQEIYAQLEEVNGEHDILKRFHRINSIFVQLCDQVNQDANESSSHQKQLMEEYLRENFGRNDMGLSKMAEDFGYASTYFSKLFKQLFGEKFATYLENMRIERVCELLCTSMSMEQIAEQTGYNSIAVMRTAFKKIKNITPGEYRKLRQNQ